MKELGFFANYMFIMFFSSIIVNCKDNLQNSPVVNGVPEPEIVDLAQLPSLSDNVYYLVITIENQERLENGPEPVLEELLANGFHLKNAWYPLGPILCMAIGAVKALVVELEEPNDKIVDFDFIAEPKKWMIINCSIGSYEYYTFSD